MKVNSHLEYSGENDKTMSLEQQNLVMLILKKKKQKKLEVKMDFEAFGFQVEKFSKEKCGLNTGICRFESVLPCWDCVIAFQTCSQFSHLLVARNKQSATGNYKHARWCAGKII